MGQWGIFSKEGLADAINPFTDSETTMIAKLKQTQTGKLRIVPGLDSVYRR